MKFGISTEVAKAAQSNRKAPFEGDAIYDVTFLGCEERTFDSNGQSYNVLDIKFGTDANEYTHTLFEPQDGDDERTPSAFGTNPSRLDHLNITIMHLFNATNPEYAKSILDGSVKFEPSTWKQLCDEVIKITTPFVGKKTKIKLLKIKTKNGIVAQFPGFPASFNKNGELYLSSTFIGDNIYFTRKETEAIKARENAVATPVSNPAIPSGLGMPVNNPVGIGGVAMPSPVGGASKLISFNM